MTTTNTISETIRAVLSERKLHVVKPQPPTMGEIALEAYGFGKACDAVALQGDDLQALLSEIGARCAEVPERAGDPLTLCACGNHARYIDEHGQLTCAICPLRAGTDSIRLADVPRLLKWARDVAGPDSTVTSEHVLRPEGLSALRSIIGRKHA
jgi:hypothetical protein